MFWWRNKKIIFLLRPLTKAGPFPAILEKAPGLNWEKICSILGYFGKFFRSVNC